jgi:hypothetical protein
LRTWSVHDGAWQREPVHTLLVQSAPPRHDLPAMHAGQEPPQSWSDSEPFVTPSLQPGGAQMPFAVQ